MRLSGIAPTTLQGSTFGELGMLWQGKVWLCVIVNDKTQWRESFFVDPGSADSPYTNDIYMPLSMRGASDHSVMALGLFAIVTISIITVNYYLRVKKVPASIALGICGFFTIIGLYIGALFIISNRFGPLSAPMERVQLLHDLSLKLSIFTGCFFMAVEILL